MVLTFASSFSQDAATSSSGNRTTSVASAHKLNADPSKGANKHAAVSKGQHFTANANPAPSGIGFLSSTQTPAGGGTFPNFPAVLGDFKGDGNVEAAAIVNTAVPTTTPTYNIAVAISQGNGGFATELTQINDALHPETSPAIFAGNLSGYTNGEDDILIVHPEPSGTMTTVEGWLSKGDGTFTSAGSFPATMNGFIWATVDSAGNVILADGATPNGNICTLTNTGKGVFNAPTCVAIQGALNPGSSPGVPGNPMVFADLNGDGFLDFAAASAGNGGTIAVNQIVVYLNDKTGHYPNPPVPLATKDNVYDSCFLGGGVLKSSSQGDLVSANCDDNSVTVYVNDSDGSGGFATGAYYAVGSRPVGVTVADVNGDGHNDVLSTCTRSADIKVLLGNGDGTIQIPSVGYVTGGSPLVPPLVADFNGDGKADIIVPDDEFSFVSLPGYGDGSFRSAVNYYSGAGVGPHAQAVNIASGDFNGDGIPDFVIGNVNSTNDSSVTVFLSNADGTLNPGVAYCPASGCVNSNKYSLQYVAVADFNGDGILDIAATDNFNGVVQIFTGNGDGTFTPGATYATDPATAANPVSLVVGDFNNDGKPDLAVVNNYGGIPPTSATVGVLINNGNGFNPAVTYPLDNAATEISAAALVNGNKNLDLVVPLFGSCSLNPGKCPNPDTRVAILLGKGDGTFTSQPDFQLGAKTLYNPYYAAIGDLNGDGIPDLAVTIEDQVNFHQGIAVAFGNGDGTFQAPTLVSSTVQNPLQDVPLPGYIHVADLNKDGVPDLVYSNSQFSTVGVLYGAGSGAFYDPIEFPADRWAWGLALVDYNGDGATDVVVSGNSLDFSGVAVLFNTGGNKTTLTSSANPSSPGAAVTLTATVASPVRGITAVPTGQVTFSNGGTALGTAAVNSGVATLKTKPLPGGTYNITAQYSGYSNFLSTTSATLALMVPAYSLSAGSTTQTVNPGSLATYKIAQTILGGYNGTVNFPATACSGLPSGTACSFSPSSVTGTGSTTLTITTTGPTGALITPETLKPHALDLWASLGGVGLVGMVLAGDWSKRNRRRMGIALAVLVVMFLIILAGCGSGGSSTGGNSGGGGGNPGTPAGTYTVIVTVKDANSNSPSTGPLKLTLVVN
jgi:hypothetical protein